MSLKRIPTRLALTGLWLAQGAHAETVTHAISWYNTFQLPAGAKVRLHADYPHAWYMSLNSYFTTPQNKGVPSDAIHDTQIVPDPGSRNPFLPDAKRTAHPGSW